MTNVIFMCPSPKIFSAGGMLSFSVAICQRACASRKFCEHHISKPMKRILRNFGHICIWVDVLIGFWGQRLNVKVTAGGGIAVEFHLVTLSHYMTSLLI